MGLGPFVETGKYTVKTLISEQNAEAMKPIFDGIADELEHYLAGASG